VGVKFGYLIKPDKIKTSAIYIHTPECYETNLIISKETTSEEIEGYVLYNTTKDNKDLCFTPELDNGMSESDCDNIIVIIDMICQNEQSISKFISLEEINKIKKEKYELSIIKQAKKNVNIIMEEHRLI